MTDVIAITWLTHVTNTQRKKLPIESNNPCEKLTQTYDLIKNFYVQKIDFEIHH